MPPPKGLNLRKAMPGAGLGRLFLHSRFNATIYQITRHAVECCIPVGQLLISRCCQHILHSRETHIAGYHVELWLMRTVAPKPCPDIFVKTRRCFIFRSDEYEGIDLLCISVCHNFLIFYRFYNIGFFFFFHKTGYIVFHILFVDVCQSAGLEVFRTLYGQ